MSRTLFTIARVLLMAFLLIIVAAFAYYVGHEHGYAEAQADAMHAALPKIEFPLSDVVVP
jgi:hypothetical protein